MLDKKPFKTLQIDAEKGICLLNGDEIKYVSHLYLEYKDGTWSLSITRDEFYSQVIGQSATQNSCKEDERKTDSMEKTIEALCDWIQGELKSETCVEKSAVAEMVKALAELIDVSVDTKN